MKYCIYNQDDSSVESKAESDIDDYVPGGNKKKSKPKSELQTKKQQGEIVVFLSHYLKESTSLR